MGTSGVINTGMLPDNKDEGWSSEHRMGLRSTNGTIVRAARRQLIAHAPADWNRLRGWSVLLSDYGEYVRPRRGQLRNVLDNILVEPAILAPLDVNVIPPSLLFTELK